MSAVDFPVPDIPVTSTLVIFGLGRAELVLRQQLLRRVERLLVDEDLPRPGLG